MNSDSVTEVEQPSSVSSLNINQPPLERPPFFPKKILKFPSLKRNRENIPLNERVKLERVLGFTIPGNASLRTEPNSGIIIYPAGCVVVLYNPRKNKQGHILNASKKTITCLDVSVDGKYVVTGECGHLPNVRVWDIQEKVQVAEFSGHKYGINCVAFSPNLKYVVSVGSQHDMIVNVWDWRSGVKLASNKVSSKVKAVAFADNGTYFVTVGNRHVKFWYLECAARPSKYKEPVPLMGRSAILGEKRNNYFCDVACGKGDVASSAFSITKSGLLCEFNSRRLLDKWVDLRTSCANCIAVSKDYVLIGCADGIVRCFNPYSLEFVTTLPRCHYLGVDVAMGLTISHMSQVPPKAKFPDTVAITYDETSRKITCVYSDHSMYIWDAKDVKKIGKSHSFLYHSACIWGVEVYPLLPDSQKPILPPGSFVTCSSDDTIRIWNLDSSMPNNTMYRKNVYCNELLKTVYVDEELSYICDTDRNSCGSNDKMDATYDTKNGVRCLRISPDGLQLASGDRSGNIRIHELQRMGELCKIEAHDAEVLNLEYTKPDTGHRLLASASRDRLIHVFDVDQEYAFQQTLDDHSSSITAVRFVQSNNQTQMISCGADKSIIFRTAQFNPQLQFIRDHHVVGKTTLYDMEVDFDQKNVLTACQDRHVRVYSVGSGRHVKSFKGSLGEDGTLIKIVLDQSGLFAATSGTDKNLCIYDFSTGECVATMYGHSELVTGLRFTNDCKHLISVSGDGCIFIWKLPLEITHQMEVRLAQVAPKIKLALRKPSSPQRMVRSPEMEFKPATTALIDANSGTKVKDLDDSNSPNYRFSFGTLPKWAKKELSDDSRSTNTNENSVDVSQPKGRWAQRIDTQGLVVRSFYSSDHVIPYPNQGMKPQMSSESVKETEYRKFSDSRRETIVISRKQELQQDFLPCPESLQQIRAGEISLSGSPPTVSTRRGQSYSLIRRLASDSSTTGSIGHEDDLDVEPFGYAEDDESLETDQSGDVDGEIIYYPQSDEIYNADSGDFKVKETNPDELRDAHRRLRKGKAERPSDLPIINVHDSDDDEDVVGTPQGNDRNLMSMLNVSLESLDRVTEREKFLKSNYESLDGGDNGFKEEESSSTTGLGSSLTDEGEQLDDHRQSFSAKYLHNTPKSTSKTAGAVTPNQKAESSSRRRQEIMQQLEQSRRKLDLIGWKATMHSSKSIGDLTELPEKDYPGVKSLASKDAALDSIRRASSMNDLSKPRRLLPSPPTYVPPSKPPGPRTADVHQQLRPSTAMSRSSSMGTLNPNESDSESGSVNDMSKAPTLSRWSRPTISSSNKSVGIRGSLEKLNNNNNNQAASPRRSAAQSLIEKRKAMAADSRRGLAPTDSSSGGEISPVDTRNTNHYTLTLPRNHGKSTSSVSQSLFNGRSRSEKDLSKVGVKMAGNKSDSSTPSTPVKKQNPYDQRSFHSSSGNIASRRQYVNGSRGVPTDGREGDMLEKSPQELPVKDYLPQPIDVLSLPISLELCEYTAHGLKQAADNMIQLYKRIVMETELTVGEREEMLSALSDGTTDAQRTLKSIHPAVDATQIPVNLSSFSKSNNGNWKVPNSGLTSLSNDGGSGNIPAPESVHLLQQYADMLMNMMQQKMSSQPS
ncbi:hypothetical protein CHUAL_009471 [Chamberlinius hualienensis]